MIEIISDGSAVTQYFGIGYFCGEEGMGAEVGGAEDFPGNISIGIFGDIEQTVFGAFYTIVICKFVHFFAALEAKVLKYGKRYFGGEHGNIEFSGGQNHIVGMIGFVYGKCYHTGGFCYLRKGVDDTAVVFAVVGGENIETVADFEQCGFVHSAITPRLKMRRRHQSKPAYLRDLLLSW